MKNFVESGDVLTLTVPAGGVVAGTPVRIGSLIVVPTVTVTSAEVTADPTIQAVFAVTGVFTVTRVHTGGTAWAEGTKIYWDDSAKTFTKATVTDSGDAVVGVAVAATADGDLTGKLRLDGVVR